MSHNEQVMALADDIDKLVDRYRQEFDLSYAAAVGVLHTKATLLIMEASERDDEV